MTINLKAPTGTGLKPVVSPTGLKLSSSPFTTQPDEEVAVVDVYQQQQARGVINSISEDTGQSSSFFDKIKNAIGGGLSSLTGGMSLGGMAGGAQGILNTARSGTNALRQITNVASRAMQAVNQIQRGGVMGTIGGLTSLGGMAGVQGAYQLGGITRGVTGGIMQGGAAGVLRAGGAIAGNQGQSLYQLASNIGSMARTGAYLQSAVSRGNFNSVLSGVDASLALTSSTLSSLDRASQINFQTGFDSVIRQGNMSATSYNRSSVGLVHNAVKDFTSRFGEPNVSYSVPTRAGTTAGLAIMGAGLGDNTVYSSIRSKGLDNESSFLAGTALSAHAASTGNLSLFKNLASDPIGLKAISSTPNAMVKLVENFSIQPDQSKQSYASMYDELDTTCAAVGQKWNSNRRGNTDVLDVSALLSNVQAQRMVSGKAADDDAKYRTNGAPINSRIASMGDAQTMAAAVAVPKPTVESIMRENPSMGAAQARYELRRRGFY